jgi:tripartite-type tricarboxylate transporter receptor subunit TctC
MCTISSGAINYGLYGPRMPYKPEDLVAAGLLLKVPNAIFVTNGLPVRTLRELVEYVKARPGSSTTAAPASAPACTSRASC